MRGRVSVFGCFVIVASGWIAAAALPAQGAGTDPSRRHWGVEAGGVVRAVAAGEDRLWFGGSFSAIESAQISQGVFDVQTAELVPETPGGFLGGGARVAVPDGGGGWYLGGRFLFELGSQPRGVIKLLPSGERDPAFDVTMPDAGLFGTPVTTTIHDMILDGSTLYVAGSFATANGVSQAHVVALDAATGSVLPFNAGFTVPIVGNTTSITIRRLALDGGALYLLGNFQTVQGATRFGAAALDRTTGALRPWDPMTTIPGSPTAIAAGGGMVWLGGNFQTIQGQPRMRLAAVDGATGAPLSGFSAAADALVTLLHLDGTTLYVGGDFATINGITRPRLAAIDAASGTLLPWAPPSLTQSGPVSLLLTTITSDASRIYVGGSFDLVGGVSQRGVVALDKTSGAAQAWNPGIVSVPPTTFVRVDAIGLQGSHVYLGGGFTVPSRARDDLAGLDLRDGFPLPTTTTVNGSVEALELAGDRVFLGGVFSNVGGQFRIGLAAIDRDSGLTSTWNAAANSSVTRLLHRDGTLYCAGNFTSLGGQPRARLGAVDTVSGLATAFDPAPNGSVTVLAEAEGVLYVGGDFTMIGGQPRDRLAAFDLASGQLLAWDPGADGAVTALAVDGGEAFIGGDFSVVGGQPRASLGAVDIVSGQALPWDPVIQSNSGPLVISAIEAEGPRVWVGGLFTSVSGFLRTNLAEIDRATGVATPWNRAPDSLVSVIRRVGRRLVVGGQFSAIGASTRTRGVAVFSLDDMATVGVVAPACSNAAVAPRLRSTRPVMPGGHQYLLDRAPPFTTGALFVSFEPSSAQPPLVLPGGCVSGLDLGTLAQLAAVSTDASGNWQYPVPLPSLPALMNLPIRAGAVLSVPGGAVSGAFDLTETLELTLGL